MNRNPAVALAFSDGGHGGGYPRPPYHPPEAFPELSRLPFAIAETDDANEVYRSVRDIFGGLQLDRDRIGTSDWNPLGFMVRAGDHVVIKPNLVFDEHPLGLPGVEAMVTHAAVVRPIVDYVLLATGGSVKITICDVPLQSASWERLVERSGLGALVNYYRSCGVTIELLDLRFEITVKSRHGVSSKRHRVANDPLGYAVVDLGAKSCLYPVAKDCNRLEITDYGKGTVAIHHNEKRNEYFLAKTILDADVVINVPKMKCHRKAGVTLSLKNLVGINGDKSWIAHHRRGIDEYPSFDMRSYIKWYVSHYLKLYAPSLVTNMVYMVYQKYCLKGKSLKQHGMESGGILMEGNWYGNDTIWRSVLDLNKILWYCDKSGKMTDRLQRRYLTIIDGIVGMESEGPMDGTPIASGVLLGGVNPVAVDYVASHVMGFVPEKIPQIAHAFEAWGDALVAFKPEDITVRVNTGADWRATNLKYRPSRGWSNHLEREPDVR